MVEVVSAVILFNLAYITILPFVFFRRDGSFNWRWWLTGTPFGVCFVAISLGLLNVIEPFAWSEPMIWAGLFCSLLSVAFISFAWGTNRVPLALWHQENDAPQNIVTYGAYKRVRHPFYTSFLLCFLASSLLFPHYLTLGCLVYGFVALNVTAAREEKRLSASEFGSEYTAYMKNTGRFWPKLFKKAA